MRIGERDCRRLVEQLLHERGLNGKDFFGKTRLQHYVDARVEAIKRMKEFTNASHETIAFVLNKESSIVRYHLSEQNKRRRKMYYAARWQRLKSANNVKDDADLSNYVAGEHKGFVRVPLDKQRDHGASVDYAHQ